MCRSEKSTIALTMRHRSIIFSTTLSSRADVRRDQEFKRKLAAHLCRVCDEAHIAASLAGGLVTDRARAAGCRRQISPARRMQEQVPWQRSCWPTAIKRARRGRSTFMASTIWRSTPTT